MNNNISPAESQKEAVKYIEYIHQQFDETLKNEIVEIEEASKDEIRSLQLEAFDLENKLKCIKQSISSINSDNRKIISKIKTKYAKDKLNWEKNVLNTAKLHAKEAVSGSIYTN